jgi:acyl carrier protein
MKNAAPSSTATPPSRDQVIEMVIDIFVQVIGFIDRNEVSRTTHVVKDFFIDTDDLSLFALEVDKHFGIRASPSEDWPGAEPTIEAIADHVLAHLRS